MWTEWKVHSVLTAQSSHFVFTTFWPLQKESFPSLGIACLFFIEQILVYCLSKVTCRVNISGESQGTCGESESLFFLDIYVWDQISVGG